MESTKAIWRRPSTRRAKCWATGSRAMASQEMLPLSPRTGRGASLPEVALTQVLPEEGGDRVERGAGRALLVVDIDDLDVAAGLAVIGDEPFGLVPGEVGIVVVVIVHDVGPALHPKRRRHRHLLAAFQHQYRITLGHGGFGLPVRVVLFLHADREGRRVRSLRQLLRIAIARQRV